MMGCHATSYIQHLIFILSSHVPPYLFWPDISPRLIYSWPEAKRRVDFLRSWHSSRAASKSRHEHTHNPVESALIKITPTIPFSERCVRCWICRLTWRQSAIPRSAIKHAWNWNGVFIQKQCFSVAVEAGYKHSIMKISSVILFAFYAKALQDKRWTFPPSSNAVSSPGTSFHRPNSVNWILHYIEQSTIA